ncbi:head-tail connector protein [Paludibaculum fermentans]|uniref:head-tail connector protein n=1 Tax=Paludibaculum fermentans TaxID=1473598 RepID=UPI003EC0A523
MSESISLDLAKSHLRVMDDNDNAYIVHLIAAARQATERYIGQQIGVVDGVNPVPADLQAAMLLTVGHLYSNRESVVAGQLYELPMGVKALLAPFVRY